MQRSNQISVRGSTEAKRLLVRRCNYHSERVLSTMDEEQTDNSFTMAAKNSNGLTLQNVCLVLFSRIIVLGNTQGYCFQ